MEDSNENNVRQIKRIRDPRRQRSFSLNELHLRNMRESEIIRVPDDMPSEALDDLNGNNEPNKVWESGLTPMKPLDLISQINALNSSQLYEEMEMKEGTGEKFIRQFGGITLTLCASFLSSTNLILVKKLQRSGLGPPEVTVIGYSGVFLPSIPVLIYKECQVRRNRGKVHQSNQPGQKKVHFVQESPFQSLWPLSIPNRRVNAIGLLVLATIGAGSIMFRFIALQFISVGDTAVISIGSPVIVTIVAHFILGEKTGLVPILMALLALLGVGIISRPPILTGKDDFDTQTLIGTIFAFGSMVCIASQTIICRKIRGVHFSVTLMATGALGMAIPFIVALIVNHGTFSTPSTWMEIIMATILATNGFMVTLFMVLALKIETAGIVSLVRTCDVLFGFLLQFFFFNVTPDIYSSIGGFIICFGVVATACRKYLENLPRGGRRSGWRKFLSVCCGIKEPTKPAHIYGQSS